MLTTADAGAVTFLAYFHYNNKGIFPFSDECKDQELKNLAELDDTALAFVRDTRRHAIEHSKQYLPLPPLPESCTPSPLSPLPTHVAAGASPEKPRRVRGALTRRLACCRERMAGAVGR